MASSMKGKSMVMALALVTLGMFLSGADGGLFEDLQRKTDDFLTGSFVDVSDNAAAFVRRTNQNFNKMTNDFTNVTPEKFVKQAADIMRQTGQDLDKRTRDIMNVNVENVPDDAAAIVGQASQNLVKMTNDFMNVITPEPSRKNDLPVGVVIEIVAGAVVFLALITFMVCFLCAFCCFRGRKRGVKVTQRTISYGPAGPRDNYA
ncbi:hypothetical protein BV898_09549 [Hypsibius exemplaris]|uniref:Uncharacterized protein n=1 Tax=Hypsibius exemplaris TaxID=2072580 RepID=A0A1W0WM18_HYPEX|nr:hypothetical protein BV898_09549 [Hypsibius exemplaris]